MAEPSRPVPIAEKPQPVSPARVVISYIHFLGTTKRTQADEFIEITNLGGLAQDVSGWRISSSGPGQEFVFPEGCRLEAGASVRVFTNLESPAPGHFSFGSKRAIWSDAGDLGQLFDKSGALIAKYGYGTYESRSVDSIKEAHGMKGLEVVCERAQLAALGRYPGKVDFFTALERALRCLIEGPTSVRPDAAALKRLLEQINRQKLFLLGASDLGNPEDAKKGWFFRYGSYRIVVDRTGGEPAYREVI